MNTTPQNHRCNILKYDDGMLFQLCLYKIYLLARKNGRLILHFLFKSG